MDLIDFLQNLIKWGDRLECIRFCKFCKKSNNLSAKLSIIIVIRKQYECRTSFDEA